MSVAGCLDSKIKQCITEKINNQLLLVVLKIQWCKEETFLTM